MVGWTDGTMAAARWPPSVVSVAAGGPPSIDVIRYHLGMASMVSWQSVEKAIHGFFNVGNRKQILRFPHGINGLEIR